MRVAFEWRRVARGVRWKIGEVGEGGKCLAEELHPLFEVVAFPLSQSVKLRPSHRKNALEIVLFQMHLQHTRLAISDVISMNMKVGCDVTGTYFQPVDVGARWS